MMEAHILKKGEKLSRSIEDYPDGIILCIDKPYRWTSADVIRKIKWTAGKHFGKKNLKVGHAGTLDPLATGILLVCIGKATKSAQALQDHDKEYLAGVSFGATTPSYDLEKDIDREYPLDGVTLPALEAVLPTFIGEQTQVAPLFSAKSVDGVRAYETARRLLKEGRLEEGSDILHASTIRIGALEVTGFDIPFEEQACPGRISRINVASPEGHPLIHTMIRVECSKGTYIRALARDLGEALGSGAFLWSLRRSRVGSFTLEDAIGIEDVLGSFEL